MEKNIIITFPDGNKREYPVNSSGIEIAKSISPSLLKRSIALKVSSELKDLNFTFTKDSDIAFVTNDSEEALKILNHSAAHLLAHAVKNLYPQALFGIGPAIEEGFYYDIDFKLEKNISVDDLEAIEAEMRKIVNAGVVLKKSDYCRAEVLELFKDDLYKIAIIDALEGEEFSVYEQDNFRDLCRGPHLLDTKAIKHFKLLSLAGAYFQGDSNKPMLTRIYGTAFFNEADLTKHLELIEERKKRDHRKLGRELELFMISEFGPGFPFWLPKGMMLRSEIEKYWHEVHNAAGYEMIQTPIMLNQELWEVSGHWENYRENMYTSEIDKHQFVLKPMNCPGGILVYKNGLRSYRDFPLKLAELGLVHRHEASGALAGLFRVRVFTQDDAHIFMTEAMINNEVRELIKLYDKFYAQFNLNFHIELSTRPEKFIGEVSLWDKAEKILAEVCKEAGIKVIVMPGEGAFYGPKLDFKLKDSMNRIWQCGTIQLDMNLPERFDLHYIDETGNRKRPIMIHRALAGSFERFIGILIEHYGGSFPLWMSPIQVCVIPVNLNYHSKYAKIVEKQLIKAKIRTEIDLSEEKLNYKIRRSQTQKIPYSLVLGNNEAENKTVTFRKHGSTEQVTIKLNDFVKMLSKDIKERK
ncbi:MAG: threonine--tRNA ligase [Erysipelotrichales bacterium]|nr:threonine--tRNA ligase [Erysipelotrichales bacterium]